MRERNAETFLKVFAAVDRVDAKAVDVRAGECCGTADGQGRVARPSSLSLSSRISSAVARPFVRVNSKMRSGRSDERSKGADPSEEEAATGDWEHGAKV